MPANLRAILAPDLQRCETAAEYHRRLLVLRCKNRPTKRGLNRVRPVDTYRRPKPSKGVPQP